MRNILKRSQYLLICSAAGLLLLSVASATPAGEFHVRNGVLQRDGSAVTLRGVNAMHVFGGDSSEMRTWPGIGIVREFVGNLRDAPLEPRTAFHDEANGNWLHSLQDVVSKNTANGMVTILCPFGWDGTRNTVFSGATPSSVAYYSDYKKRMQDWVKQFQGQRNVWIELWNEPFSGRASTGVDARWLSDTGDMADNLRGAGWDGIIVVPGASWGQDETVIERQGAALTSKRGDIVFDVHIYEQWLGKPATIEPRLRKLRSSRLPVVFGEIGPHNNVNVMDPAPFLAAAKATEQSSVIAWIWSRGEKEPNSLLTRDGQPNDIGNFGWASTYRAFLAEPH
ncbi:MAG: cellulase family glycosylhydrolase [Capsulimonadaceae bacterium]|nr:cellulase family glycosylhydrolase [Capsulimonadaceae bacterium]